MSTKKQTNNINARGVFEEEILYGLINNKSYFDKVVGHLKAKHFSDVGNSFIFDRMQRYYDETGLNANLKELVILFKDDPASVVKVTMEAMNKVNASTLHITERLLIDKTEAFIKKAIHTESLILGAEGMGQNDDKKLNDSYLIAEEAHNFALEDKSESFEKHLLNAIKLMKITYPQAENVNIGFIPLQKGVLTMISGRGGVGKGISVLRSAVMYLEAHPDDKALLWFTEDSERVIQSRLIALGVTDNVLSRISIMTENPNKFEFKNTDITEITEEYDFVVIDPLSHFYFGDENNNNEVAQFMSDFNNSCIKANNVTILVHHHSKQGETRGAGAFTDNSRLVYHLYKEPNEETKCVRFKANADIPGDKEIIIQPWNIKHPVLLEPIINTGLRLGTTNGTITISSSSRAS